MDQANILRRTFERIRPHMSPALIIIGAQKAGTSALFSMLSQHPKAAPPAVKELDFFSDDAVYGKGMAHYRSLFPVVPAKSFGHFTFEASPTYLVHAERCAPRIAQVLPDVTCVAILRDPVARAYSDWNMFRQFKGHPKYDRLFDPRSFEEAIRTELKTTSLYAPYLSKGYYAQQLERYFAVFPKEQLLIFPYPSFKKHPAAIVSKICTTARLPTVDWKDNLGKVKANVRPYLNPLPESLREELAAHFNPHQEALWELLGERLELNEE